MTTPAPTLSPGAYLRLRRESLCLEIEDVADQLETEPHLARHVRADWIAGIERDELPASIHTIVALRRVVPFDLAVLEALAAIHLGLPAWCPPLCPACALRSAEHAPPNPLGRHPAASLTCCCPPAAASAPLSEGASA